jgi:phosphate-selective porin OprO and OprP
MKRSWLAAILAGVALSWTPALTSLALGQDDAPSLRFASAALVEEAAAGLNDEPGCAERVPAKKPAGRFRWEDHRTVFESELARLELSNRVQFRFSYEDPGADQRLTGTVAPGDAKGSFRIRRAKTTLEGWFWKPELKYELQLSWAGPEAGASTNTPLEDAIITWDASKKGLFEITFGQFKVPFGRQELTTSSGLQFVDRSLLTFEFTRGRDVGVMVGGQAQGGKLAYRLGMFNGNAASQLSNANTKFQYDARVTFSPFGDVKYREGDLESTDKPLVAFAAQFEHNDLRNATNANDMLTVIGGGDVVFKYRGLSLFGEYFFRRRTPEEGAAFDSPGFNVQAGYFIVPKRLELALRFAGFDPTDAVSGNDRREKGVAVNYLLHGHNVKIQADFRRLEDKLLERRTDEVRLQTQLVF